MRADESRLMIWHLVPRAAVNISSVSGSALCVFVSLKMHCGCYLGCESVMSIVAAAIVWLGFTIRFNWEICSKRRSPRFRLYEPSFGKF